MSLASDRQKRFFIGPRALRRGSLGEAVKQLQQLLEALGYDTGPIDGRFGFMTEDALLQFQREHRLRPDGIAGYRVFEALHSAPARGRTVHIVRQGERLFDVAKRHHIPIELLRRMNRLTRSSSVFPGQRLLIRSSCVMLGMSEPIGPITLRHLTAFPHVVSAVVDGTPVLGTDGTIDAHIDPQGKATVLEHDWNYVLGLGFSQHQEGDDPLEGVLRRSKNIRRFVQEARQLVHDHAAHGLVWDVGSMRLGQGRKLLSAIEQLRRALPETNLTLAMMPPLTGFHSLISDIDYHALSGLLDYCILSTYRWNTLLKEGERVSLRQRLSGMVSRITRSFPAWKVLLGIPLGASVWQEDQFVAAASYREAVTEGYIHRQRPQKDPSGFMRLTVGDESTKQDYVLQGMKSFGHMLGATQFYRLGGAFFYPVGYEDRRQWELVSKRIKARPLV